MWANHGSDEEEIAWTHGHVSETWTVCAGGSATGIEGESVIHGTVSETFATSAVRATAKTSTATTTKASPPTESAAS
eukprot:CAMPEP_0114309210 /NCGR_PEP_ID=MMETSP0059-20121206/18511_1 /TAXON_ID=36894 /ORGANISM="Pyramimonas parkeae, Strain CCMP726" /LENGTH=76 /DNA_ID=CAMNT_0001432985 /DNA_START=353 /DNA_END=581 /DNA_ORIENTATION=+